MDRARHILDMNDNNPNALKWIKNVKSNWNGIQKMVEEIKNYQNKKTFQERRIDQTIYSGYKL